MSYKPGGSTGRHRWGVVAYLEYLRGCFGNASEARCKLRGLASGFAHTRNIAIETVGCGALLAKNSKRVSVAETVGSLERGTSTDLRVRQVNNNRLTSASNIPLLGTHLKYSLPYVTKEASCFHRTSHPPPLKMKAMACHEMLTYS